MKKCKSIYKKAIIIFLFVILILIGRFFLYTSDYYHSNDFVLQTYMADNSKFAYYPLLKKISLKGIATIIIILNIIILNHFELLNN